MELNKHRVPSALLLLLLLLSNQQQEFILPAVGPALCLGSNEVLVPLTTLQASAEYRTAGGLGSFVDLSALGGPAFGMAASFLQLLQQVLVSVFSSEANSLAALVTGGSSVGTGRLPTSGFGNGGFAAGFAAGMALASTKQAINTPTIQPPPLPMLPPLPSGHPLAPFASKYDLLLKLLANKWADMLVKFKYNPGLQGFLKLLGLDHLEEALLKWVCILFPWGTQLLLPKPVQELRNAYCLKALPAAAVSNILSGPPGQLPAVLGPALSNPLAGSFGGLVGR
eukprot:gene12309-12445_t